MNKPFGKYTLTDRLGGGGMAEVFRAVLSGPQGFEKQLAIKLILPHVSDEPEFVRMFFNEATLAAHLTHANIVGIYEFDQIEGRYYLGMELVDGRDLRHLLLRSQKIRRSMSIAEALLVTLEICRGLAYAHGELTPGATQIIHRDISPHNVMVSRAGEVKITDFGIAKITSDAGLTHTGTVKGKLAYMSPEQAEGQDLDSRTDLFSLGCVLWEMLSGSRLFAAANEMAILNKLKYGQIQPPSVHNSQVSPELDQLVLHCLARERENRISSASELARQTDQILSSLPNVDRQSVLVELYQTLFGSKSRKTAVMPLRPPMTAQSQEHLEQNHQTSERRQVWFALASALMIMVVVLSVLLASTWFTQAQSKQVQQDFVAGSFQIASNRPQAYDAIQTTSNTSTNKANPANAVGVQTTALTPSEQSPARGTGPVREGTGPSEAQPVENKRQMDKTSRLPPSMDKTQLEAKETEYGRLFLNVWPGWAKVYHRTRYLGDTPVENAKFPRGWQSLTLINQELGLNRKVRVRIRAGKTTKKSFQIEY